MKTNLRFSSLLCFSLFFISAISAADDCVYTLFVRTGSILKAGTDSKISVTLGDAAGKSVYVPDLEVWGLMGRGHDYFERGNTDIFSVRAPCIPSPLCRINVTSDGTGDHHGWYCDSVEVTSTGAHINCSQTIFYVEQWLGTDVAPYELSAVLDGCGVVAPSVGVSSSVHGHGKAAPLVVRNKRGYAASQ